MSTNLIILNRRQKVIDTSILSDHAQRESGWPGEYGTENCSENHQDHRQIRYALRHVENLEWEPPLSEQQAGRATR